MVRTADRRSRGMFSRSPDHVASFMLGMAMKPDALPAPFALAANLTAYYRYIRDNDVYVVYAVVPPQAAQPEFLRRIFPVPTLRVVREEDDGVVIAGMKCWQPARARQRDLDRQRHPPGARSEKEAITCAVPCNAPVSAYGRASRHIARRHLGVRFAGLALRRKRQHGAVRQRQGAVGGVRAR